MYESFFGFRRRPFPPIADPRTYVALDAFETARAHLLRCLLRGEGIGLLIGGTGGGKTLMLRLIEHQLEQKMPVIHLEHGRIRSASQFYDRLLRERDQSVESNEESQLRWQFHRHIKQLDSEAVILLIDDAHLLPMSILEEIRLLTNLDNGASMRMRVVLAGNSRLEEHLTHPRLDSFNQRVVLRSYLEPLSREETGKYLARQLAVVDHPRKATLFDLTAQKAIHQATGGIPRLINQLADHTLLFACETKQQTIDEKLIQQAWASLQQLPPPEIAADSSPCRNEVEESVIEFGSLDEDDFDDLPAEQPTTETESLPMPLREEVAEVDSPRQIQPEEPSENDQQTWDVDLPSPISATEGESPIDESFDQQEAVSQEAVPPEEIGEPDFTRADRLSNRPEKSLDWKDTPSPEDLTEPQDEESFREAFPSLTCEKAMQELSALETAVSQEIEMIKELQEGSFIASMKYPFEQENTENRADSESPDLASPQESKEPEGSDSGSEPPKGNQGERTDHSIDGGHQLSPPHFLNRPLPENPSLDSLFTRLRDKRK